MVEENTGHRNSGDYNSGDFNSGNRNSGDFNSGDFNSGDSNTGRRNSGDCNSGDCNSGDYNSGDFNSGNRNSGDFNTVSPEYGLYFNKPLRHTEWYKCRKPLWIRHFKLSRWVETEHMTDEEKEDNPEHKVTGGFIENVPWVSAWREAYSMATEEDLEITRNLPNFDYDVFEKLTGLDLRKKTPEENPCDGKIVEIDGVKYELKEVK